MSKARLGRQKEQYDPGLLGNQHGQPQSRDERLEAWRSYQIQCETRFPSSRFRLTPAGATTPSCRTPWICRSGATWSVHALTEPMDPLADFEMYFFVYFHSNPPMMQHSFDSHCMNKFMEALPLMRTMSGSRQNEEVDRRWMEVVQHQIGPDGLAYLPVKAAHGRSWEWKIGSRRGQALGAVHQPDALWPAVVCPGVVAPARCARCGRRQPSGWWMAWPTWLWIKAVTPTLRRKFSGPSAARRTTRLKNLRTWDWKRGVHCWNFGACLSPEPAMSRRSDWPGKLVHYMLDICKGFDADGRFQRRRALFTGSWSMAIIFICTPTPCRPFWSMGWRSAMRRW